MIVPRPLLQKAKVSWQIYYTALESAKWLSKWFRLSKLAGAKTLRVLERNVVVGSHGHHFSGKASVVCLQEDPTMTRQLGLAFTSLHLLRHCRLVRGEWFSDGALQGC